ncbi:MAG: hypothetical protein WBN57_08435 [Gammaproteobacteria bacterium]
MIMPVPGKMFVRIISHCALILVLLLGQSIALGHHHDTDTNSSEICVLCLYVQQLGNVLPMSTFGWPAKTSSVCTPDSQWQQFVAVNILSFQSRAPPFISL